jgi:GT2 family glycosyltransferase
MAVGDALPLPVTATVCNFNGAEYLPDCLESLLAQSHPLTEIRVYDNASEDDSVELVRRRFPSVTVISLETNAGPCPARTRGLVEATTEWVLQVDSDVVLAPDCLEKLVAEVRDAAPAPGRGPGEGGLVAVYMPRAVFHHDPGTVHYDGGFLHYVGVMTLDNFFRPVPAGPEAPRDVNAVISMALLARRSAVLAVGGYHAPYFILFEDHDLSYRLRATGKRLRLVPGAVVYHKAGTPGISYREGSRYPARRAFLHSRNRWMLLLRNHSLGALVLGLPGVLAYEATWVVFATLKGNLLPYLRGKAEVVRALPRLLGQRRAIQRLRRVGDRELLEARPLSHAPMTTRGKGKRGVERALDLGLRLWWSLVRRLLR